jgi:hypothetical protein
MNLVWRGVGLTHPEAPFELFVAFPLGDAGSADTNVSEGGALGLVALRIFYPSFALAFAPNGGVRSFTIIFESSNTGI